MESAYYIIKPAVDTPETGNAYPAAESYDDYDFNAPNSVHKLNFREFPNFEPDIRFKLAKGAKLTDMLSQAAISAHGFLINEKLKNAFEQFKIVPHKYYPATVEDHQGNVHQYFWLHLVWKKSTEPINFPHSKFRVRKFSKILDHLQLNSYEEFKNKSEELGHIKTIDFENLVISNVDYDIFILGLSINVYTNENTRKTLSQRFYGVDIINANKLIVRQS